MLMSGRSSGGIKIEKWAKKSFEEAKSCSEETPLEETQAVMGDEMWLSCSSTLLSGWFQRQNRDRPSLLPPSLSVVRLRRSSGRLLPSPSCWLPWKRWASQPASRRRYGMFWLVFTIWELPGPVKVTLIHHRHSHSVSKPSRHQRWKKYSDPLLK